jgi:hypothetical protein
MVAKVQLVVRKSRVFDRYTVVLRTIAGYYYVLIPSCRVSSYRCSLPLCSDSQGVERLSNDPFVFCSPTSLSELTNASDGTLTSKQSRNERVAETSAGCRVPGVEIGTPHFATIALSATRPLSIGAAAVKLSLTGLGSTKPRSICVSTYVDARL